MEVTRQFETPEKLMGKQLVYRRPLERGDVITTDYGIQLKLDSDWGKERGTSWMTLDGEWMISADKKGFVIAVDALGD